MFQFFNLMHILSAQKGVDLPLLLTNLSSAHRYRNASVALELVDLAERAPHITHDPKAAEWPIRRFISTKVPLPKPRKS